VDPIAQRSRMLFKGNRRAARLQSLLAQAHGEMG
jgi:hypothetical protein